MSTETEDKKDAKDPKAAKGDTRAKAQLDPSPKNEAFAEWLERLFEGTAGFPEKIDTRVVMGRHGERLGPYIKQIIYPPTAVKPSKGEIVNLSNRLLFEVQRDCDQQNKRTQYAVLASHFSREVDYYARWVIRCSPSGVHNEDGPPAGDDEDETLEGLSMPARFAVQVLTHKERMFALYQEGYAGILDRLDRIVERQDERIAKQDETIAKQNEMMERALSLEAERAERREWNKLKIASTEKAINLGVALAPVALNAFTGKSVFPTGDTGETIAIRNLFRRKEDGGLLTQEQTDQLFGVYDAAPPHNMIKAGILTAEQAKLLYDVGHKGTSPDELDRLLFGGDLQVSLDQLQALQAALPLEQLLPLQLVFEARYKRKQAATQAQQKAQAK